jgi:hypothetical protein
MYLPVHTHSLPFLKDLLSAFLSVFPYLLLLTFSFYMNCALCIPTFPSLIISCSDLSIIYVILPELAFSPFSPLLCFL